MYYYTGFHKHCQHLEKIKFFLSPEMFENCRYKELTPKRPNVSGRAKMKAVHLDITILLLMHDASIKMAQ